jgi:carbon starvation protein
MGLPALAAIVVAALVLGYRFYGRYVAAQFALDDGTVTPAHRKADGVDFVPTRPFYLFGQHFSAIAAAGPIVGPILACQQFGWLPCLLWISFGVVFVGAVHDASALVASVRHDAKSIAEVVKVHLGRRAWLAILAFIWLALVYVIVAFVDITAGTFVTGDADNAGLSFRFNQGGAVALASLLYLGLALIMGTIDRLWHPPLWLQTLIFVPATLFVVWFGTQHSTLLVMSWKTWVVILMAYCAVASVTPMWLLMQPRGYLGGFVLYGALLVGVIGIFLGGFDIKQPSYVQPDRDLVRLDRRDVPAPVRDDRVRRVLGLPRPGVLGHDVEADRPRGPLPPDRLRRDAARGLRGADRPGHHHDHRRQADRRAGAIYATGLGKFIALIIGDSPARLTIATTFGAMALSTFIFDTLDSATRLGRYVLQELFGAEGLVAAVLTTLVTCLVPLGFLLLGSSGGSGCSGRCSARRTSCWRRCRSWRSRCGCTAAAASTAAACRGSRWCRWRWCWR